MYTETRLKIVELCKAAGITQAELAERIELSRVGLSKAINGNPTLKTLDRIAKELNVPITALFEVEQNDSTGLVCPACGAKLKLVLEENEKRQE